MYNLEAFPPTRPDLHKTKILKGCESGKKETTIKKNSIF